MKLVSVEKKIIYRRRSYTKWLAVLEEFQNIDAETVKLEGWTNANAKSCVDAIRVAIDRFGFNGIHVVSRNEEVYLIKTV